jgi:hypothetical protein
MTTVVNEVTYTLLARASEKPAQATIYDAGSLATI